LTELIDELGILTGDVRCVVAGLSIIITPTDTTKRVLLTVNFSLNVSPYFEQVCMFLQHGAEDFRLNLWDKLGVAKRFEVAAVLEDRRRVGFQLLPFSVG